MSRRTTASACFLGIPVCCRFQTMCFQFAPGFTSEPSGGVTIARTMGQHLSANVPIAAVMELLGHSVDRAAHDEDVAFESALGRALVAFQS